MVCFLYFFCRNKSRLFRRWSCSVDWCCSMMAVWLNSSSGGGFKHNVPAIEVCTRLPISNRLPPR
ncbi:hypothetical protein Hanom_Chr14g01308531 [Helianthus anomalus]